ncbi:hypothetical protein V6N11_071050 [Hibiscus sabdariffa]|uniref:Uncharacterized protein n=1 Tax=Hibiscus sabdariffa TaxID=183260 RepID=A0ABR1ZNB8_9ROSI
MIQASAFGFSAFAVKGLCSSPPVSDKGPENEVRTGNSSAFCLVSAVGNIAGFSGNRFGHDTGTRFTIPHTVPVAESFRIEALDFLTNKQQNPDGFSPKTLKNEQIRKSGLKRESPRCPCLWLPVQMHQATHATYSPEPGSSMNMNISTL